MAEPTGQGTPEGQQTPTSTMTEKTGAPSATPPETENQEPDWMPKRLERARQEAITKLLADLGVTDMDALKQIFTDGKAALDGQKTELQRATEQVQTLTADRDAWKAKYDGLLVKRKTDMADTAIRDAVGTRSKRPEDVVAWAQRNAVEDLDKLVAGTGEDADNFTVNETLAKSIVTKCLKARPEWFTEEGGGVPSNQGASVPTQAGDAKKIAEAARKTVKKMF
jgi:hypothetical protein